MDIHCVLGGCVHVVACALATGHPNHAALLHGVQGQRKCYFVLSLLRAVLPNLDGRQEDDSISGMYRLYRMLHAACTTLSTGLPYSGLKLRAWRRADKAIPHGVSIERH